MGRPIRASAQVLEAVGRTLRLDAVERQHLFRLAEMPDTAAPDHGGQLLRPEIQAILDGLSPMPASVVTERYDILAWNAAYTVLFPRTAQVRPAERNSLLYCFTRPAATRPSTPAPARPWRGWSASTRPSITSPAGRLTRPAPAT